MLRLLLALGGRRLAHQGAGRAVLSASGIALGVALAGAGTSTAIAQSMSGTAYRTFTHSLAEVKLAAYETLALMGLRPEGERLSEHSEIITASAIERSIEIELEPISAKATRMRVVTRSGGLFYDAATATEIVLQTEKALGVDDVTNASVGPSRRVRR